MWEHVIIHWIIACIPIQTFLSSQVCFPINRGHSWSIKTHNNTPKHLQTSLYQNCTFLQNSKFHWSEILKLQFQTLSTQSKHPNTSYTLNRSDPNHQTHFVTPQSRSSYLTSFKLQIDLDREFQKVSIQFKHCNTFLGGQGSF